MQEVQIFIKRYVASTHFIQYGKISENIWLQVIETIFRLNISSLLKMHLKMKLCLSSADAKGKELYSITISRDFYSDTITLEEKESIILLIQKCKEFKISYNLLQSAIPESLFDSELKNGNSKPQIQETANNKNRTN